MNIKKVTTEILKYLFLVFYLCLLAAILYAAEFLRQWSS